MHARRDDFMGKRKLMVHVIVTEGVRSDCSLTLKKILLLVHSGQMKAADYL